MGFSTGKKLLVTKRNMRSGSGALSTWGTNLDLVCENHGLSGTHSFYFYNWFFKGTLVTRERVEEAFKKDIQSVLKDVFIWSNDCNQWPAEVKQIISNMMFNMGRPSMDEFVNFK